MWSFACSFLIHGLEMGFAIFLFSSPFLDTSYVKVHPQIDLSACVEMCSSPTSVVNQSRVACRQYRLHTHGGNKWQENHDDMGNDIHTVKVVEGSCGHEGYQEAA